MALTHGVNASKRKTSVSTPIKVASGVHFAVGAAPVQMVGGKTNEVIMANDYEEAVRFLGYSDDWEKYPLCMEIYTAFTLYNVAPVIMVNVLDPKRHKKKVEAELEPQENQILLPLEALADTVTVENMERDTDYTVFYTDDNCAIEFMTDTTAAQKVKYDAVDPSLVTKDDIIGGYSVTTHKTTGPRLFHKISRYLHLAILPDYLLKYADIFG